MLASRGNGRGESYQAVDHQYASLVDTLQKDLRRLGTVLTSLKRSSDAIGTARETDKIRSDLKQLTEEGRQLISTISTQLKTKFEDAVSAPSVDRTERNTRKLQQQKFVKDLQERVSAYQSLCKETSERERQAVRNARRLSSVDRTSDDDDEEAPADPRRMHMQQVEFNEAIIEERNEEIMEINRSVLEVNDIMKDLATMVVEQQKDIDEVEVNITEGQEKVKKGVESLEKASEYQKKSRGKLIGLLVLVLVIAITLGVVLYLKLK